GPDRRQGARERRGVRARAGPPGGRGGGAERSLQRGGPDRHAGGRRRSPLGRGERRAPERGQPLRGGQVGYRVRLARRARGSLRRGDRGSRGADLAARRPTGLTMRFTVYTLFPGLISPYLEEALLARAVREGIVQVDVRDLRRFAGNRTNRVDDAPYGGGAGMVVRVDVAAAALDEARRDVPPPDEVVLLSPAGEPLTQDLVSVLATREHVCLLAGRYEGFDARVERLVSREVSIGDFVLM